VADMVRQIRPAALSQPSASMICEARYLALWISPRRVVGRLKIRAVAKSITRSNAVLVLQVRKFIDGNLSLRVALQGDATVIVRGGFPMLGDATENSIGLASRVDDRQAVLVSDKLPVAVGSARFRLFRAGCTRADALCLDG